MIPTLHKSPSKKTAASLENLGFLQFYRFITVKDRIVSYIPLFFKVFLFIYNLMNKWYNQNNRRESGGGAIMANQKIYDMPFAKIYPMLIAKAEKKGGPEKM